MVNFEKFYIQYLFQHKMNEIFQKRHNFDWNSQFIQNFVNFSLISCIYSSPSLITVHKQQIYNLNHSNTKRYTHLGQCLKLLNKYFPIYSWMMTFAILSLISIQESHIFLVVIYSQNIFQSNLYLVLNHHSTVIKVQNFVFHYLINIKMITMPNNIFYQLHLH